MNSNLCTIISPRDEICGPGMTGLLRRITTALVLMTPLAGHAASFQVTPVRVSFERANETTVMQFFNTGDEEASVQVEALAWSQTGGEDVYSPTEDVVAVPPIFKLKAGEKRIIRVALLHAPDVSKELAYRLFFTELPDPRKTDSPATVRMLLRIGVPVFVAPQRKSDAAFQWVSVTRDRNENGDQLTIKLRNTSNFHVQVQQLQALERSGKVITEDGGTYLLPGSTRELVLNIPSQAAVESLRIISDTAEASEHALTAAN
ncbi:MAG: fimbrial biogenesis chaperone [Gammaproteobacteria bacterium]